MATINPAQELSQIVDGYLRDAHGYEPAFWLMPYAPDKKWSRKMVLGHLIDSAIHNLTRFVTTQYQQNTKILYDADQWVAINDYEHTDIATLLLFWGLLNKQIVKIIANMPSTALPLTCDTGKNEVEPQTLAFLVQDYIVHLKYHLNQINKNT